MKIQKTVTQKVVAANRRNARKGTGPRDPGAVNQNACKHGLLAKHLRFQSADQEAEFASLLRDFEEEYQPSGVTESALVEEAAVCLWKLGILEGWALEEFVNRRNAAQAIVRTVAENCDEKQLPFFTQGNGSRSAAQLGWDCQELLIRSGTSNVEDADVFDMSDKRATSGHVLIAAKLNSSIDTIARYQSALKKDFYRAIAALRDMQRERLSKNSANVSEVSELPYPMVAETLDR